MKFSEVLARKMKTQGLTLTQLAQKTGVPKPTLHGWMTGRRVLDPERLRKVAGALEVSVHELLFGTPDPFHRMSPEILQEVFRGDVRVTIHRINRKP